MDRREFLRGFFGFAAVVGVAPLAVLGLTGEGEAGVSLIDLPEPRWEEDSSDSFPPGWNHVAFVREGVDSPVYVAYLNGERVAPDSIPQALWSAAEDAPGGLWVRVDGWEALTSSSDLRPATKVV